MSLTLESNLSRIVLFSLGFSGVQHGASWADVAHLVSFIALLEVDDSTISHVSHVTEVLIDFDWSSIAHELHTAIILSHVYGAQISDHTDGIGIRRKDYLLVVTHDGLTVITPDFGHHYETVSLTGLRAGMMKSESDAAINMERGEQRAERYKGYFPHFFSFGVPAEQRSIIIAVLSNIRCGQSDSRKLTVAGKGD